MHGQLGDEKISRRNWLFMILSGSVFWFATPFIDGNAVISVFLNETTGSIQLAGLTAALRNCMSILGQFVIGLVIYRVKDYGRALHALSAFSRPIFLLAVPLLFFGVTGMAAAIMVIVLLSLFYFSDGLMTIIWLELTARTIQPSRRASSQGYQQVFGGVAGLLSAVLVKALLDSPAFDFAQRYMLIFGICGGVFVLNAFVMLCIRDFPRNYGRTDNAQRVNLGEYLKNFVRLWKADKNFRQLMYCRMFYVLGLMGSALFVLFGMNYASLTPRQSSAMLYYQVAGQVVGGYIWILLCKKYGNNFQMVSVFCIPILTGLLGVFVHYFGREINLVWCIAAMVFMSGAYMGGWLGINNRMIDIVEPADRTQYLVMNSLIQFPFSLAAYFAGLAAEIWSFLPVFVAIGLSGLAGLWLSAYLYKNRDSIQVKVEVPDA